MTGPDGPGVTGRPPRRGSAKAGPTDVLHLSIDHDPQPDGVSLGQGRALLAGIVRLLQAAALAVLGPAPRFPGRRPDLVKAFVEQDVRFSHADARSSLLAVLTRLDEDPILPRVPAADAEPGGAPVPLVPFQRRAGILLAGAVLQVAEATRAHRGPRAGAAPDLAAIAPRPQELLRALVLRGVSTDLCDALIDMVTTPRVRSVELSFYWAPRVGLDTPAVVRAAIRRSDLHALARLRGDLALLSEPRRMTAVYGQVTRLDRGDDSGGVATIRGVIGRSTPRTVQVAVAGAAYDNAIHAYRTRLPVVATGKVRRQGGVHVLTGQFSVATAVVGAVP